MSPSIYVRDADALHMDLLSCVDETKVGPVSLRPVLSVCGGACSPSLVSGRFGNDDGSPTCDVPLAGVRFLTLKNVKFASSACAKQPPKVRSEPKQIGRGIRSVSVPRLTIKKMRCLP